MIVNATNAVNVINLFTKLSDQRFSMRSVQAIKSGTDQSSADVMNLAALIGAPVRRRVSDDKLFIERPVTIAEAAAIVDKAQAVLAGTEEPFELDFNPAQTAEESLEAEDEDLLAGIERGLTH